MIGKIARELNYEYFRRLVPVVIARASNVDIRTAVLDLIARISRTNPPQTAPASLDTTSVVRSTSSFRGKE
jgi:hypothetical protein